MSLIEKCIECHLSSLGLKPEALVVENTAIKRWAFSLAPGILSDLFLTDKKSGIHLEMTTVMDYVGNINTDILCTMIAPFVVPLTLTTTQEQVGLNLFMVVSDNDIEEILSQGIILSRRMVGLLFSNLLEYDQTQKTLEEMTCSIIHKITEKNKVW